MADSQPPQRHAGTAKNKKTAKKREKKRNGGGNTKYNKYKNYVALMVFIPLMLFVVF